MTVAGVAALYFPATAPAGPVLIEVGAQFNVAGTAATTTGDVTNGDFKAAGVDVLGYGFGKVGGAGIKKVVGEGFKQEGAQVIKDFALDAAQEEAKKALEDKKEIAAPESAPLPVFTNPEQPNATQQSDHTAVAKPLEKKTL